MGHALREHARARLGRRDATDWLVRFVGQVFGWDRFERSVADVGGAPASLKFDRDDAEPPRTRPVRGRRVPWNVGGMHRSRSTPPFSA